MLDEPGREPPITQPSTKGAHLIQDGTATSGSKSSSVELPITSAVESGPTSDYLQNALQVIVALLPLGILTGVGVAWAFLGRIPIEVEGRSVLIIPGSNVEVQSRATGKVLRFMSSRVIRLELDSFWQR